MYDPKSTRNSPGLDQDPGCYRLFRRVLAHNLKRQNTSQMIEIAHSSGVELKRSWFPGWALISDPCWGAESWHTHSP